MKPQESKTKKACAPGRLDEAPTDVTAWMLGNKALMMWAVAIVVVLAAAFTHLRTVTWLGLLLGMVYGLVWVSHAVQDKAQAEVKLAATEKRTCQERVQAEPKGVAIVATEVKPDDDAARRKAYRSAMSDRTKKPCRNV